MTILPCAIFIFSLTLVLRNVALAAPVISLPLPLLLAERLRKAASDADSFRPECSELGRVADLIAHSLRALIRCLSSSNSNSNSCYSRPARRVAAEASKSLDRALSLARRCRRRRSSLLRLGVDGDAVAAVGGGQMLLLLLLLAHHHFACSRHHHYQQLHVLSYPHPHPPHA